MIRALLYLQLHSSWNRLISRLKRLKKPKYLAGFLVGGFYFYFYCFSHLFSGRRIPAAGMLELTPKLLAGLELLGAAVLFGLVLVKWILPYERVALAFSEAEVTFLFPAPVNRRTLIHFKLLKSQAGILFTTLLMAFLSNRLGAGGSVWIHLVSWWIVLSTLNLHFLGASFARTRLLDMGIPNWQRRLGILLLLAVLAGVVVFWARKSIPAPTTEDLGSLRNLLGYGQRLQETEPLPYLLYPFRLMVRPLLAQNAAEFFGTLWPAFALMALHYVWVIRSDVAFEEASAELARKRAEQLSSVRPGHLQAGKRKPKRAPFALSPTGPPAVALLWKNLIGAGSVFTLRMWLILSLAFGMPALLLSMSTTSTAMPSLVGMLVLLGLFWSVLAGPQLLRQDFRQDLRLADVLKVYPLAGWRVVLGELLAPAAILTALQWILLLVGTIVLSRGPDGAPLALTSRLAVASGAAMIFPTLNLVSLLIPNAAALLFPSWFQAGQASAHGLEATGQRLIFAIGQLLVFLLALVPAAAAFALAFFFARFAVGWLVAVPLASAAGMLVLTAEVAVGVGILGKVFERFDLSAEAQT